MSQDRRLNYRVTPSIEREVFIDLVLEGGGLVRVTPVDISAGGIGVGLVEAEAPEIRAGERLQVRFSSARLEKPIEIASQVRHVKIEDDLLQLGIAFDDWGSIRSHLAPRLRTLFNEREAVRVEPRTDEEVQVMIRVAGPVGRVEGLLRDISILGVGMWVQAEDRSSLTKGDTVRLEFSLPPSDKCITIEASICHYQMVGHRARVGLQIQSNQPGRWNGVHKEITQYVMKRQMETARLDAERKRELSADTDIH